MHTKANIKCITCGYDYAVFGGSPIRDPKSLDCPSCLTEMDHQMKRKVIVAMGTLDDLNRDFRKYSGERKEPIFQVSLDFVPDRVKIGES